MWCRSGHCTLLLCARAHVCVCGVVCFTYEWWCPAQVMSTLCFMKRGSSESRRSLATPWSLELTLGSSKVESMYMGRCMPTITKGLARRSTLARSAEMKACCSLPSSKACSVLICKK